MPEPSVGVPADVKEDLDDDALLYRRALICLNRSYGVAACAYLRRILESRIDPFLGIVRRMREDGGADEAELARTDEISRGKVASEKIRLAGDVIPDFLEMNGDQRVRHALAPCRSPPQRVGIVPSLLRRSERLSRHSRGVVRTP